MRKLSLGFALVVAFAASVEACSGDDNTGSAGQPDASTHDSSMPAVDAAQDTSTAPDSSDAAALSDPQIIGVMDAANTGEVQQGQLAGTKAASADVKAFASRMVTDHTAANAALTQLEQQTSLTAQPSATQAGLQSKAQQALAALQALSGEAFDVAYVQSQVDAHTQVLALLDQSLIPAAQNASLATLLQKARTTVAMHLQMAKDLAAKLADGGTGATDAGADALDGSDAMAAMD